jgi:squalene-hopene/tetraprenyl-beta-curcumene cyclase
MRTLLLLACLTCAGTAELPSQTQVLTLIDRAQAWLASRAQPDGSLAEGGVFTPGITALVAGALAEEPQPLPATHPAIAGAIRHLAALRQTDGGVYAPDEGIANYTTACVLRFVVLLPDPLSLGFDVPKMQDFLLGRQNRDQASPGKGGIGYGPDKQAGSEDLSNTAYAIDALRASGMSPTDPRLQAALAFVQRCQDLKSANPSDWVGDSGGGVYGPQDAARSWENRSLGSVPRHVPTASMTYALISTYLLLDLKRDDPRVQAAVGWLARNYGFDANPGLGHGRERQGLFHSQALAARALDLLADQAITLPDGSTADWRADLFASVSARAHEVKLPDGTAAAYWLNDEQRWGEGIPHLCTAYAVRALKAIARNLPR